jgi:polar amino acid transport system substrate-binding protein
VATIGAASVSGRHSSACVEEQGAGIGFDKEGSMRGSVIEGSPCVPSRSAAVADYFVEGDGLQAALANTLGRFAVSAAPRVRSYVAYVSKRRGVFLKQIVLFMFSSALFASECMAGCDSITVHYNDRVPYLHATGNGVEGLTATPAATAFKEAGIPFQWKNTPSKRQMKVIEDNGGCDCAVGWFKNPERERFARYTRYIYQDRPQIALARADNEKLRSGATVDSVLSNPELTLEIKDGYSYGTFLDAKIAQYKPKTDRTTNENINMLKMIHARRADYLFISPEEADALVESSGLPKKDFKYITFPDMPEGEKRYMLCSRKVGDELIHKLNEAIEKYVTINRQ